MNYFMREMANVENSDGYGQKSMGKRERALIVAGLTTVMTMIFNGAILPILQDRFGATNGLLTNVLFIFLSAFGIAYLLDYLN